MRSPRRLVSAVVAAVALTCAIAAQGSPAAPRSPAGGVLAELNRIRAENGLRPLRHDRRLARASRGHVADLLRRNAFEHGDVQARLRSSGARGPLFGENLAYGPRSYGPRLIVEMWLNSPAHRRNMLRPGWRRAGIGVATGTFSGYTEMKLVAAAFAGR